MRMRKKRHLDQRLEQCGDVCLGWLPDYIAEQRDRPITEPFDRQKVFGNLNPVHLEIGCGKGRFIQQMAEQNPDINFIALEQTPNVLITALERTQKSGIKNLRYYAGKAEYLEKVFAPRSVERIYLNFSCPYPKERYAKHRLTHPLFLKIYASVLAREGDIRQKTDNRRLFEFSVENFSQHGWRMKNVSLDLHNSGIEGNIMTEYEERFTGMGMPIYYLEAYRE
ncbi:MAG: tRNA (guanosine(46)-N7)-methyltransferase TrmB [Bacteroides sp.]|nr:tRNA (guanosine(46)-N7)-methyltransferase TrmB [Bacteroides sp.]